MLLFKGWLLKLGVTLVNTVFSHWINLWFWLFIYLYLPTFSHSPTRFQVLLDNLAQSGVRFTNHEVACWRNFLEVISPKSLSVTFGLRIYPWFWLYSVGIIPFRWVMLDLVGRIGRKRRAASFPFRLRKVWVANNDLAVDHLFRRSLHLRQLEKGILFNMGLCGGLLIINNKAFELMWLRRLITQHLNVN